MFGFKVYWGVMNINSYYQQSDVANVHNFKDDISFEKIRGSKKVVAMYKGEKIAKIDVHNTRFHRDVMVEIPASVSNDGKSYKLKKSNLDEVVSLVAAKYIETKDVANMISTQNIGHSNIQIDLALKLKQDLNDLNLDVDVDAMICNDSGVILVKENREWLEKAFLISVFSRLPEPVRKNLSVSKDATEEMKSRISLFIDQKTSSLEEFCNETTTVGRRRVIFADLVVDFLSNN